MSRQQQRLLDQVRSLLPQPLAEHCLHARIQDRRLILHVDSPAWHSRLRFLAPQLLHGLRNLAPHLEQVVPRVLPPHTLQHGDRKANGGNASSRRIPLSAIADDDLRALLRKP